VAPGPPTQLRSLPKVAGQLVQLTELSPQSATHSSTLPIMSNAPHTDLQLDREPVSAGPTPVVTHVVEPTFTESGGHRSVRARTGNAAVRHTIAALTM
jgi:hypothetical protein